MSGLGYTALNALRGGYSGSDADREAIYGLGLSSGQSATTNRQIDLQERELEERIKLQKEQAAMGLVGSGWGTSGQASTAVKGITGYELESPYKGLSRPQDTTNVGNLGSLMGMQRFAGSMRDAGRGLRYGESESWGDYSSGIGQMARKILSAYR